MIKEIDHMNPCRRKVPIPILKRSKMFSSVIPMQNSNLVCPQIQKIKNSRSVANILNLHSGVEINGSEKTEINKSNKKSSRPAENDENNPVIRDNHQNIKDFSKKRSVQTLLG